MIRHAPSIGLGLGLSLRGSGVGFTGLLDLYGGAAAAYSLRALSAGWVAGDVVEVRPSSGWTPASFTANQVANGELVDYVKRPGAFTNSGFETFVNNGTGDGFTATNTAVLGTATANLNAGVALDVVIVAFDLSIVSGSPTLSLRDGSSVASNLETFTTSGSYSTTLTAAVAFDNFKFAEGDIPSEFTISNVRVSTNDGFVSTWYDQSGNGNNATQITTTSQPKIVDAGSLVTGGLDFDGVDDVLNTSLVPPEIVTLIGVSVWDVEDETTMIVGARDSADKRSYLSQNTSGEIALGVGNSVLTSINVVASTNYLSFGMYSGSDRLLSVNGSPISDALGVAPTNTAHGYSIGALNTAGVDSGFMNGTIAEVIVYDSNQSANRVGIETNINDAYSIY